MQHLDSKNELPGLPVSGTLVKNNLKRKKVSSWFHTPVLVFCIICVSPKIYSLSMGVQEIWRFKISMLTSLKGIFGM